MASKSKAPHRAPTRKAPAQPFEEAPRKPGRPPGPIEKKSKPLNLGVDVWEALDDRAAEQDTSRSAVADDLLRRILLP